MRVKSVEVSNIKGVEHVLFTPGALTVVRGSNGSGKSSILDALRKPFEGGHDPALIRRGSKRGSVRIALDTGAEILLKITEKSSSLTITDDAGREVASPKKFVESLAPILSVDPGRLLDPNLKQKEIAAELLETITVSLDPAEVDAAANGNWWRPLLGSMAQSVAECAGNPLGVLERVRTECYERRKLANREARESDSTEQQLVRSLPDGEPGDWKAELEAKYAEASGIDADCTAAVNLAQQMRTAKLDAIRHDIEARIAELRVEQESRNAEARAEYEAAIAEVDRLAQPERARVAADVGALRAKADLAERVAVTRKLIDEARAKIKRANGEASAHDLAIERLDSLRNSKLEGLPIAGLTWDGSQFLIDGTAWEHVNTARKIDVVLQLAVLRSGPLQFLVLDNSEALDSEGFAALKAGAEQLGFQIVAAKVDETELEVVNA